MNMYGVKGGISTILVSFTIPSTLSREEVFSGTSLIQPIFTANNDVNLLHFHLHLIVLFLYHLSNLDPC